MRDKIRSFLPRLAKNELASRVGSALGLALLALAATLVGGVVFALFWAAAAAFFLAEFLAMIGYRPLGHGCRDRRHRAHGRELRCLALLVRRRHRRASCRRQP